MSKLLLGIDVGNTLVKAVLFDVDGTEVAAAHRDGGTRQPRPGFVERDIGEMQRCAAGAIRDCLEKSGARKSEILALACVGHGNGAYLVDRQQTPLLGIQSLDSRAADLAEAWNKEGRGARIHPLSRQHPWPSQTATLLAWLKRNEPGLYARTGHLLFCKDVISHFLTGNIRTDYSDASGGALLDFGKRDYSGALLDLLELSDARAMLPALAEPTEFIGTVTAAVARETGLAEGTPVSAGMIDVVASAIGSGVAQPGEASIVAGTWSINQVITEVPLVDPGLFMVCNFRRDRNMAIEASATSATNFEWFLKEFMSERLEADGRKATLDFCNALAAEVEVAADLPIYHPYLYGSSESSAARGGYYGIAGWHTRAHLIYAVMEGVAFGHRLHVEKLRRAGAVLSRATLSGGAARSAVWAQIFADVLGIEIVTAASGEAGALGAAMAAGVGAGVFSDFEAASRNVRVEKRYLPDASRAAVLERRYRLFSDLAAAMRQSWKVMEDERRSKPLH